MNKQLADRLKRLESAARHDEIIITRIIIKADGTPSGVAMARQADGAWTHEALGADHEAQ
jgi:hypothetical protein